VKQHLLPTRAAGRVGSDSVEGRIKIPSAALVPRIVLKWLSNLHKKIKLTDQSTCIVLYSQKPLIRWRAVSKTTRIIKLQGMPKYTGFLDVGVLLLFIESLGTDVGQSLTSLSHKRFVLFNMIVAER
jgi:hypothetical protein